MNYLKKFTKLNNRYILCRHGQSKANEAGIIACKPHLGIYYPGLTLSGRIQAEKTAQIAPCFGIDSNSIFYCSPFRRCVETAQILAKQVSLTRQIQIANDLRERSFGIFDQTSKSNYQKVYKLDCKYPSHNEFEVETVWQVMARVTGLIQELEWIYYDRTIVLITHADIGEILQASFEGLPPYLHRKLPKLRNGRLRKLQLTA